MGTLSKVLLVLLRLGELACGAIVLGIIAHFFYLTSDAGLIEPSGRLVYATVIAALTVIDSLVFIVPLAYAFWSFPLDFFFFFAWLVVFCVLMTLTRTHPCQAEWYRIYWGYYWGRWYRVFPPGVDVLRTGCSAWRTVLAFSFVAMILYLLSAALGVYWTMNYGHMRSRSKGFLKRHTEQVKTLGKAKGAAPPHDVEEHGTTVPTTTAVGTTAAAPPQATQTNARAVPATTTAEAQPASSTATEPPAAVTAAAPGTNTTVANARPEA